MPPGHGGQTTADPPRAAASMRRPRTTSLGDSPRSGAKTTIRLRQVDLLTRLRSVPCLDCGGDFPPFVMEFDHREPATKRVLVCHRAGRASDRRILEEVAKCDIVCSNCHRNRTFVRRHQTTRE